MSDAATAAIEFALETECGLDFLRCWNEGDFESIKKEWPDAPDEVYIGSDTLYNSDESKMSRKVYTFDEVAEIGINKFDFYEYCDGEFLIIETNDEFQMCHPHDLFYSKCLTKKEELKALAMGKKVAYF